MSDKKKAKEKIEEVRKIVKHNRKVQREEEIREEKKE